MNEDAVYANIDELFKELDIYFEAL